LSSGDELIYPIRTGSKCRGSNPKGRSKSGAVGTWQTATLETEICGQRLSTTRAANESRRRSKRPSRPTAAAGSRGNVAPFCGGGNHVDSRRLPGGAERIRTSDLRTAKPRSAIPLGDVACELVSRTASRPDDEQLFSSGPNPQPSPQRDGSARLAAKMNGTERFARHDAAPTPDRLRAGFGLASS
jgi:hypothetical protein